VIEAFREFGAEALRLMRWWLVVAASIVPIAMVFGSGIGEAAALAIAIVPLGISIIGMLWFYPFVGGALPTRARVMVGFGWFLVMLLPSAAATALVLTVLQQFFGVES